MSKGETSTVVENPANQGNPLPSGQHCCEELTILHFDTKGQSADNRPLNPGNFLCVLTQIHVEKLISEPDFSTARCDCHSTSVHMVQVCDGRGRIRPTNDGEVEDKYEQSPDFCRFALSVVMSLILTALAGGIVHRDCHCICP